MAIDPLADAAPRCYWTDRPAPGPPPLPLAGPATADLVVVGGGLTGLWAAVEARAADPQLDVALVESRTVGFGASGRNGGFVSESLTHGLAHGLALWPDEMATLLRMGRENIAETAAFLEREGISPGLRMCGKTHVAVQPHQVQELVEAESLLREHGEDAVLWDRDTAVKDVDAAPTHAALRTRTGGGLVDPAALVWGLREVALRLGVRIYENTPARAVDHAGAGLDVATDGGTLRTGRALLATAASPPLLRRLRSYVLPVYDHVLVTEPLTRQQWDRVGWAERQGLTTAGNQFHYSRPTDDGRILWGGYDAVYYFGNGMGAAREQRDASHRLLARHFAQMFPQLDDVRFTHRWAGPIDSTSRFTPAFGTAMGGRVGYVVGFTGLGVGASRFGARTALDLLYGRETERTALTMVRRHPVPFPPEPLRWPLVQITRSALAREDRAGRRGGWLRVLDRFGVGFNS